MKAPVKAVRFRTAAEFRGWLLVNHASASELVVTLYRKDCGRGGITYAEALDEALCFGWIDGVRRKSAPESFTIRFTPRRRRSIWSLVNVRHAERLIASGRMDPAGQVAFEARDPARTGVYSFEKRPERLSPGLERILRANTKAWGNWGLEPPGYRRTAAWWVMSAVREETRLRRLAALIEAASAGRRIRQLS